MKNTSHDIKAYKFGLYGCNSEHFRWILRYNRENSYIKNNYKSPEEIIDEQNGSIIEFDQVSGLLLKDLYEFDNLFGEEIIFVMYDELQDNSLNKHSKLKKAFYISYSKDDLDKTIDDIILKYFRIFPKCLDDDNVARRYNCFVERYYNDTENNVYKKIDRK